MSVAELLDGYTVVELKSPNPEVLFQGSKHIDDINPA